MEINVWTYAFEPPGPAFSESNNTKYNWNEISVAPVDLGNYPNQHEVLGAIVYFTGPFTNTSNIDVNYKIYNNNTGFQIFDMTQTVPPPPSEQQWDWYKLKFWTGRASWEIKSPMIIRIEINISGWVSGSATLYSEVVDSSLNLNQYIEIPSYSGPIPPASGFIIAYGDGFRYWINYPGEFLIEWGDSSNTWMGNSIKIAKGNALWYYHINNTDYMAITIAGSPEPPLPLLPSIKETIIWEANVPDHGVATHTFYLFSFYGINTNGTIGGFQIYNGTYDIIDTPSMSRDSDLITPNVSQYDCLTIIAEDYDITKIYDAWIQNSVI